MPNITVISQMVFRTTEEAGDYQSHVFDESGLPAELRTNPQGTGYVVVTVTQAKNKEEADAVSTYLRDLKWHDRSPQVVISTQTKKGGTETTAPPIFASLPTFTQLKPDSPKVKEYRRKYRKTQAFKSSQQKYQQSSAGRFAQKKYAETELGKSARMKYQHSEKGVAARKAYQERRKQRIAEMKEKGLL